MAKAHISQMMTLLNTHLAKDRVRSDFCFLLQTLSLGIRSSFSMLPSAASPAHRSLRALNGVLPDSGRLVANAESQRRSFPCELQAVY